MRVDYASALDGETLSQAIAAGSYDPEGCVLVTDVARGSAAWTAGVRKGMFISHMGHKRVSTPMEFRAAAKEVGEKLDIRLTQPVVGDPETRQQPAPTQ
jgi:S1-C subfamily serine protease